MTSIVEHLKENLEFSERLGRRSSKSTALVIQQFPIDGDTETLVPQIRESISNIISFVELGDVGIMHDVLEMADGMVDAIIMDADCKLQHSAELIDCASNIVRKSKLFYYSDTETWAEAAFHFILGLEGSILDKSILLAGSGLLHEVMLCKFQLLTRKLSIQPKNENYDIVIGASYKQKCLTDSFVNHVSADARIYDIGIGNFSNNQLLLLRNKTDKIYRFDNRAGISSMVLAKLETDHLLNRVMGSAFIKEVKVVAGGIMGEAGDVVIDDIKNPSYVIGIADGTGFLRPEVSSPEEQKHLSLLRSIIE